MGFCTRFGVDRVSLLSYIFQLAVTSARSVVPVYRTRSCSYWFSTEHSVSSSSSTSGSNSNSCQSVLGNKHRNKMADQAPKFIEYFPRKFCGDGKQCPQAHFITFERFLKASQIDEKVYDQVSDCFFRTLGEKAVMWMDDNTFASLKALKTGFLRHFSGSVGISGDLQNFHSASLQPGETVREFSYRLKTLATRLDLPDALIKDRFINGLPDHIKFQVLPFYNKEYQEIFEMAQNMASVARPATVTAAANVAEISDIKSELGKLTTMLTKLATVHTIPIGSSNYPSRNVYDVESNAYHVQPQQYHQRPSNMYNAPHHQYIPSWSPHDQAFYSGNYDQGNVDCDVYYTGGGNQSGPFGSGARGGFGHSSHHPMGRGRGYAALPNIPTRPALPAPPVEHSNSYHNSQARGSFRGRGFGNRSQPICFYCHEPGHIWSNCPVYKKDQAQKA